MALEPDEPCPICYEVMAETDNLTFCRYGCGKNMHVECLDRWVRFKS
jgi:hypothetical protein